MANVFAVAILSQKVDITRNECNIDISADLSQKLLSKHRFEISISFLMRQIGKSIFIFAIDTVETSYCIELAEAGKI